MDKNAIEGRVSGVS